jgi:carbonic anhydrase
VIVAEIQIFLDCGMAHWHDADFKKALLEVALSDKDNIEAAKFGEIPGTVDESVKADIAFLKASPWIKESTELIGLKYDTDTGVVSVVE